MHYNDLEHPSCDYECIGNEPDIENPLDTNAFEHTHHNKAHNNWIRIRCTGWKTIVSSLLLFGGTITINICNKCNLGLPLINYNESISKISSTNNVINVISDNYAPNQEIQRQLQSNQPLNIWQQAKVSEKSLNQYPVPSDSQVPDSHFKQIMTQKHVLIHSSSTSDKDAVLRFINELNEMILSVSTLPGTMFPHNHEFYYFFDAMKVELLLGSDKDLHWQQELKRANVTPEQSYKFIIQLLNNCTRIAKVADHGTFTRAFGEAQADQIQTFAQEMKTKSKLLHKLIAENTQEMIQSTQPRPWDWNELMMTKAKSGVIAFGMDWSSNAQTRQNRVQSMWELSNVAEIRDHEMSFLWVNRRDCDLSTPYEPDEIYWACPPDIFAMELK